MAIELSIQARFWKYVYKRSPDDCWLWIGFRKAKEYGQLGYKDKKLILAHRLSYCIAHQIDPSDLGGMFILHSCNNAPCVNPDHLRKGTHCDNMIDMVAAKNSLKGKKNPNCKLTENQVIAIRNLENSGLRQRQIATQFGVCRQLIGNIYARKVWKWL